VNPADGSFLHGLRLLCDDAGALLIFDEVQCGIGRSGVLWAHELSGATPDIMTLAKPLAGGLPIGAILVTEEIAQVIEVGDHGSTFAAGPLVCTAAQVVFERICRPSFLKEVQEKSLLLKGLLQELPGEQIVDIRGEGLLVGVEFDRPVAPIVTAAREKGLLVISAGEFVLRLCPPLTITRDQIKDAVMILSGIV
jgi:acetylornithine/succinyldiaminopimelate/putrescine aminotransferase